MAKAEAKRRGRTDLADQPAEFFPTGNRWAGVGYTAAVLGLVPGLGLVLGPLALLGGWLGTRKARRDPDRRGASHATAALLMGLMETPLNLLGWGLVAYGLDWF
jgi:hypothetical protein